MISLSIRWLSNGKAAPATKGMLTACEEWNKVIEFLRRSSSREHYEQLQLDLFAKHR